MKYLVLIIILLIILSLYVSSNINESFTVYQINYNPGTNQGLRRCICSAIDDCKCLNDNQLESDLLYF